MAYVSVSEIESLANRDREDEDEEEEEKEEEGEEEDLQMRRPFIEKTNVVCD